MIIPKLLREIMLKDNHGEHLGIVRSKQLARIYLWWPKLDNDLENMVKVCQKCQEHYKNPKASKPGTGDCGGIFKISRNFSSKESKHKNNHRKGEAFIQHIWPSRTPS